MERRDALDWIRAASRVGRATQAGVVGSLVSGGSLGDALGPTRDPPAIVCARNSAATATVGRRAAPKPKVLARSSALGGRGAGAGSGVAGDASPEDLNGARA